MIKQEKEKVKRETEILGKFSLNEKQLRVIRKLITPSTILFPNSIYSKRTIEAVLQGRRKNDTLLYEAIQTARIELELCNATMNEINTILSSNNTTL